MKKLSFKGRIKILIFKKRFVETFHQNLLGGEKTVSNTVAKVG